MGARESLNGRKNMAQKKSKERREEPLGTMSYQTSSKRSPPFWLLIGARKTQVFLDFPSPPPLPTFIFWLLFHFSRGQNRESRSSVFLCSETKRKHLLRRLTNRRKLIIFHFSEKKTVLISLVSFSALLL